MALTGGSAGAHGQGRESHDLDASHALWGRLKHAATEDYRLLPDVMRAVTERIGRHFDFDCCCNDSGDNAHAPRFASPSRSLFDCDIRGLCVWMNAPFSMLAEFIGAYAAAKRADPSTSGCILVPKWSGSWRS